MKFCAFRSDRRQLMGVRNERVGQRASAAIPRARLLAVVSMWLAFSATSLHAQRAGAPPFPSVLHSPGYGVSLQVTRGAVLPSTGRTTAVGATIEGREGAVTLNAGGALLHTAAAGNGWSVDGGIARELCAPLRAASITGGFSVCNLLPEQLGLRLRGAVGHSSIEVPSVAISGDERCCGGDAAITEAAIGLGVAIRAPIPTLTVEAWTEPRLHVRGADALASRGLERTSRAGLGWSLGIAVTATSGLGGSIVVDRLWIEQPPGTRFYARGVGVGVALHYIR